MRTIELAIWGPIARRDLAGLCARVCALLERECPAIALCDVSSVAPDAVTVDALARLQLVAGRRGCQVRLLGCGGELRELVAFMGLRDVFVEADPPP